MTRGRGAHRAAAAASPADPGRGAGRRQDCAAAGRTATAMAACRASGEAWRRGLARARRRGDGAHGAPFHALARRRAGRAADAHAAGRTEATPPGAACRPRRSSSMRMAHDIVHAYYAHPDRLERDRLGRPGKPARLCPHGLRRARSLGSRRSQAMASRGRRDGRTAMSDDPLEAPRAAERPRARRVPARRLDSDARIRRGRGGRFRRSSAPARAAARWPANWRRTAFRSSRSMPDPISGRWRISPPTKPSRPSSTGPTTASSTATIRCSMGSNNSGKAVGGSTVHFAMVSLRFRPEWFKSRSLLGYGADWPLDWREMWSYYAEVEQALKIAGPVTYPWGPQRPRYPYRAHELNAAARALARGCEAMGIKWTETPLATVSAPRGLAPSLRLSRLLRDRLLDQRQAERAGHLDSARDCRRRRNPRSRDGRQDRDRWRRPGNRRALSSRRPLALPARPQRRRCRLRDRDAAAAVELGHRPLSRWSRQQLPGWSART